GRPATWPGEGVEMQDGSNGPGTKQPVYDVWHAPRRSWIAVWIYAGFICLDAVVMAVLHAPEWVAIFLIVPAVAAIGYAFIAHHNAISKQEGVERQVYLESTGIAFFVVMASLLAWYFLEVFADMP